LSGDLPEGVPAEERELVEEEEGDRGSIVIKTKRKVPRNFYIYKRDADKYGFTRGCRGCESWFKGLSREPHSDACRARFAELMKEDIKVKNQAERKRIFEEEEKERAEKKEEKKKKRVSFEGDAKGANEMIPASPPHEHHPKPPYQLPPRLPPSLLRS
jgi:hypothetical protein